MSHAPQSPGKSAVKALAGLAIAATAALGYQDFATMRKYSLGLRFESHSGYYNDPTGRAQMRKGVDVAMKMWQTALPEIQYAWVSDPSTANFTFYFGNYTVPANRESIGEPCKSAGTWAGCADVNRASIYICDKGLPRLYEHDAVTFISRKQLYDAYVPATYPPIGHNHATGDMGYTRGTWGGIPNDITTHVYHEFAHILGMSHKVPTLSEWTAWYGMPKTEGGSTPSQPYPVNKTDHPDLPEVELYGKSANSYYGGGTPSAPLRSGLNALHPLASNHMIGVGSGDGQLVPPAGMPWVPFSSYNSRHIFSADLTHIAGNYKWSYPRFTGVVRLERLNGQARLSNDWSEVLSLVGNSQAAPVDPYFVTSLHPRVPAHRKLAAGAYHTLAIRHDGTLWAWGANFAGQLGIGNTTAKSEPTKVGSATDWLAVAAGPDFSLGLRANGTLYSWGSNASGQLGDGSSIQSRASPAPVCNSTLQYCSGIQVVTFAAGDSHALAVDKDGQLWSWGSNGNGQLGGGGSGYTYYPMRQGFDVGTVWVQVAAGASHSLGLTHDGRIFGWGLNGSGQLGTGNTSNVDYPVQEATFATDWTQIAAGGYHSLALKADGTAHGWGYNGDGAAGNPDPTNITLPRQIVGEGSVTGWVSIDAGAWHSGGLKLDGRLFTWGYNGNGQLGVSDNTSRSYPTPVHQDPRGLRDMKLGGQQSFMLDSIGTLWGFGENSSRQLGAGSVNASHNRPITTHFSHAPKISIDSRLVSNFSTTESITFTTLASPNVARVTFKRNGATVSTDSTAPFTYTWSSSRAVGSYTLVAVATDRQGSVVESEPYWFSICDAKPLTFTETFTNPIWLSNEGTLDWARYGRNSATDIIRKAGIVRIVGPTVIGAALTQTQSSQYTFRWTGGGPQASETTDNRNGSRLLSPQPGNAFVFSLDPGGTTVRTFKLYLQLSGKISVKVSGGFYTPNTTQSSIWSISEGNSTQKTRIYSFAYAAEGSFPDVQVSVVSAESGSAVRFMAATLR